VKVAIVGTRRLTFFRVSSASSSSLAKCWSATIAAADKCDEEDVMVEIDKRKRFRSTKFSGTEFRIRIYDLINENSRKLSISGVAEGMPFHRKRVVSNKYRHLPSPSLR